MKQVIVLPKRDPAHDACKCRNHAQPIDGLIFVSPSCKVHYAEARVPQKIEEIAYASEDWSERERRPRVHYPKMTVAKR